MSGKLTLKTVPNGCVSVRLAGSNRVAFVSEEDAGLASQFSWRLGGGGNRYAVCILSGRETVTTIYLHRLLMGAVDGEIVDHRDGDGLNCTRENLRVGTMSENNANRSTTEAGSGFRNVYPSQMDKRRWQARVEKNGGVFRGPPRKRPEVAAHDADTLLRALYGEWATLNFPRAGERAVNRPGA